MEKKYLAKMNVMRKKSAFLGFFLFAMGANANDARATASSTLELSQSCELKVTQLGPREPKKKSVVVYLFRVENVSSCFLDWSEVKIELPSESKLRRLDPKPTRVEKSSSVVGPIVIWNNVDLASGMVKLFEVGVRVPGTSSRGLRNRVCINNARLDGFEVCKEFKIDVVP